jgi:mono/diheme cytochrome c family protein
MTRLRTHALPGNRLLAIAAIAVGACAGCHRDMYDQSRYDVFEESDLFADGRSARPLVAGTVPYGKVKPDEALQTGRANGELVTELPVDLDEALLRRGRERFDIFCSVCHGRTGEGNGMIVQRGYRTPPTFHNERLRGVPIGHLFDVATNGFGAMPSYALQTSVHDRWAIAAYIRTLQFSQYADAEILDARTRQQLESPSSPRASNP